MITKQEGLQFMKSRLKMILTAPTLKALEEQHCAARKDADYLRQHRIMVPCEVDGVARQVAASVRTRKRELKREQAAAIMMTAALANMMQAGHASAS